MPMPLTITSLANPRVKRVMKLRKPRERRAAGMLLAEGPREVSRAAAAGLRVVELWVCREILEQNEQGPGGGIPELLESTDTVIEADAKVFTRLTYRDDPEGVLAVVEQPARALDALPETNPDTLVLVSVGTAKPGNLGAMVRTADAAGCSYVLAPQGPADTAVDLFNPNAIRASTGAVFSMPTVPCDDDAAIAFLQQRRLRILAATPDGGQDHTAANLTGPTAVVIGPEDTGLPDAWLDAADTRVRIPMRAATADSLNASVAAAVLLFEALRQRG